jgi:hypothetical protein
MHALPIAEARRQIAPRHTPIAGIRPRPGQGGERTPRPSQMAPPGLPPATAVARPCHFAPWSRGDLRSSSARAAADGGELRTAGRSVKMAVPGNPAYRGQRRPVLSGDVVASISQDAQPARPNRGGEE